jgi:tRNA A37 threonylcarbamoyladenosine dehydratase
MKIEYNKTERRKILVIGVGGIGSYLVPLLHKSWCYDIHIADNDSVEVKNLLYQNYKQRDVGHLKITGIKKLLQSTNHDFDIGLGESNMSRYQVLTSKQLEGYDLVICCADNLAVRKLLYSQGFGDNAKLKWLIQVLIQRTYILLMSLLQDMGRNGFTVGLMVMMLLINL